MNGTILEHINITVRDVDRSTRFLLAALPDWRVRGEGRMDWFGKPITWRHVGGDGFYVALQGGGEGEVEGAGGEGGVVGEVDVAPVEADVGAGVGDGADQAPAGGEGAVDGGEQVCELGDRDVLEDVGGEDGGEAAGVGVQPGAGVGGVFDGEAVGDGGGDLGGVDVDAVERGVAGAAQVPEGVAGAAAEVEDLAAEVPGELAAEDAGVEGSQAAAGGLVVAVHGGVVRVIAGVEGHRGVHAATPARRAASSGVGEGGDRSHVGEREALAGDVVLGEGAGLGGDDGELAAAAGGVAQAGGEEGGLDPAAAGGG